FDRATTSDAGRSRWRGRGAAGPGIGGARGQRDPAGDPAEALARFARSGDFAGFAGNGIPGDCGSTRHPRRHGEKPDQSRTGGTGSSVAKAEAGSMNCAELEQLICDYVDGTLPAVRTADVEPPPELITRILFDAPWARKTPAKGRGWFIDKLSKLIAPLMQPRFAM